MKLLLLPLLFMLLVGCDKKQKKLPERPPPMRDESNCLVDLYDDDIAKSQHCVYGGYTWKCVTPISYEYGSRCERLGEASGERLPTVKEIKERKLLPQ